MSANLTEVCQFLMTESPFAMFSTGYALAQKRDLKGLLTWLTAIDQHQWRGLLPIDDYSKLPLIVAQTVDGAGEVTSQEVAVSPALIVAHALRVKPGDQNKPLTTDEIELLECYLHSIKSHSLHLQRKRLQEELVYALAAKVDRSGPMRYLLERGVDYELKTLKSISRYNLSFNETALNAALSPGRLENNPHAFLAVMHSFGDVVCGNLMNDPMQFSMRLALDVLIRFSRKDTREVDLFTQADPVIALQCLRQIELRFTQLHSDKFFVQNRQQIVSRHINFCALNDLAYNPDIVKFLLGEAVDYRGNLDIHVNTTHEMLLLSRSKSNADFERNVTQLILDGLTGHCHEILHAYRLPLMYLVENPGFLNDVDMGKTIEVKSKKQSAYGDAAVQNTPLMFVAADSCPVQPDRRRQLDLTLQLLKDIGALDSENAPNQTTVMHFIAARSFENCLHWLMKFMDVGLDPLAKNSNGKTPDSLVKDKSEREAWRYAVRSKLAKDAANQSIAQICKDMAAGC